MYNLRELRREDIPIINKWRNDPDLISKLGAPFRYINEEVDMLWYENYMKNRSNTVRLAMTDESDVILGLASLTDIDYINRSCTAHFMIGNASDRGKGLGTFAIEEILKHAFMNLNLNRVELSLLSTNTVIYLYKKLGFIVEGTKRKAAFKNGSYVDVIEMAMLKEDYDEKYRKN